MGLLKDNEILNALKKQLQQEKELIKGKVKTTSKGFGFLAYSGNNDILIPTSLMVGLLPDMELEVYVDENEKGKYVSEIKEVISNGQEDFFCRINVFDLDGMVYANAFPLRSDLDAVIQLGSNKKLDFTDGDIVHVTITKRPDRGNRFKGKVVKRLGHENEPNTMWELVKSEFQLNDKLERVMVDGYPNIEGYKDWTDLPLVTIDSFTAKDLDDALYVEDLGLEWMLHIAIADPTLLFDCEPSLKELFVSRGVTSYLATEIIHLMMTSYSENCFSLLEGSIRPAIGAKLIVNKHSGEVVAESFQVVVIKSKAKLSYDQVAEHIRQRTVEKIDADQDISTSLNCLWEMSQRRKLFRENNSLVSIDDPEYYFVIENGLPIDVRMVTRKLSHQMVEEAAIAANVAFTQWANALSLPIVYVTHSGFKRDQEQNIRDYLLAKGVDVSEVNEMQSIFDLAHRCLLQRVQMEEAIGDPYTIAMAKKNFTDLRSFYEKGELSTTRLPHQPMGLDSYATWTSPIRKSVDMLNHVVIKEAIKSVDASEIAKVSSESILTIQEKIRSSRLAERKLNRLLGLAYLKSKLNESVDVVITCIMSKAIRVEVKGTGISSTMGFAELGFKGFVSLNPVAQTISEDDVVVMKIGDIFGAEIKEVSVFNNILTLCKVVY